MLATAIALVVLGVALGLFFPVMFVAAAAGAVLLIVFFATAARRAKTGAPAPADPGANSPE